MPDRTQHPGVDVHRLQHPRGEAPLHPPGVRGVLEHPHYQAHIVLSIGGPDVWSRGDAVLSGFDDHQLTGQQS